MAGGQLPPGSEVLSFPPLAGEGGWLLQGATLRRSEASFGAGCGRAVSAFIHKVTYSFNKWTLSTYCVPDTGLGVDTWPVQDGQGSCPYGILRQYKKRSLEKVTGGVIMIT